MPLILNGKTYRGITLTGDRALETYTNNAPPPEDVQKGREYFSNGKKQIGTGKAFEFAEYGSKVVRKLIDCQGIERYGFKLDVGNNANVVFIAPTNYGDIILQKDYNVNITSGIVTKLGDNHTTGGEINAIYDTDKVLVYITNFSQEYTVINYFVGKDNAI